MPDGSGAVSWGQGKRLQLTMQSESAECALACLVMISRFHGHDIDLASLRRRFSSSLKGVTLARVTEIAGCLGFECRPLKAELQYLPVAEMPCIAHWDMNHFVVISSASEKSVTVYDPARGRYTLSMAEASRHFTGILLEVQRSVEFEPIIERQRVSILQLTGSITGVRRSLIQVLGLALGIEAVALIAPLQIQLVIDQTLAAKDTSLLAILTASFLLLILIQSGLSLARGWLISWIGANISSQWVTNLFGHLLRLPLDFFGKRHLGDVITRFSSVYAIQSTLTGSFVAAAIDGLTGILALAMLSFYSLPMTACVLATLGVYAATRFVLFKRLWRANEEYVVFFARQQSELMESVRGIQAIKLANKQSERRARLANATVEASRRQLSIQRINVGFSVFNQSLFGTQRLVLISMGAYFAMSGEISAGMLVAFIAYSDQFANKFSALIDKVVEFKMLGLHSERISDIALTRPEGGATQIYSGEEPEPSIAIKSLGFRYSDSDPWVVRNLNLSIRAGESIAIVGASGCGKSTLAKLILGLLTPQEGVIEFGGVSTASIGPSRCRSMLGAVMQDDHLFSGSIAENIAFCDPDAQPEAIEAAGIAAAIHREIQLMPMGYETMVGDMGSVLSGGQRQRLLLARALYRNPRIIVLDEATSHLDTRNEALTNATIREMSITRIIIAHRKETISQADRVFDLSSMEFLS